MYLVRHGQTEWNRQRRLQGFQDSPLSELGHQQAKQLGEAIKRLGLPITQAWVSPLGRARQTAEQIAAAVSLELEFMDDLREVSFGDFEGNTLPELDEKYPGAWEARTEDKWGYRPPGGESNADALNRAQRMAARIEQWQDDCPPLIIAHFAINRLILSQLIGVQPEDTMRMNVPHGGIYRVQYTDGIWKPGHMDVVGGETDFRDGWLEQIQYENR